MKISFKLLENNQEISKRILEALQPEVKSYMDKAVSVIKKELPNIIMTAIKTSPEYDSIIGGALRFEFGLVDGSSKIDGLLQVWANNVMITYNPPVITGSTIQSIFNISMIKADYSDVLGTDYANMVDDARGYSLPWLKWLLLDGTKEVISNHKIIIGPNISSRTSMAVMRRSKSGWGVPQEFSGTETNNWITRAIDTASESILTLLKKAF